MKAQRVARMADADLAFKPARRWLVEAAGRCAMSLPAEVTDILQVEVVVKDECDALGIVATLRKQDGVLSATWQRDDVGRSCLVTVCTDTEYAAEFARGFMSGWRLAAEGG